MARTKFTFEKRQRELARQQKQKDKMARRAEAKQQKDGAQPILPDAENVAGEENAALASAGELPGQEEETHR